MILPETAEVRSGRLFVGGCDTVELAATFGTPLYLYDEETIRGKARSFVSAFGSRYEDVLLCYAAKAFLNPWMARLAAEEGLGLDVVSGGELAVAQLAHFPMERVHFHGNNKLAAEIEAAVDGKVGRIVIDNFREIELLDAIGAARGKRVPVLLRVAPGVEAHTHEYLSTGGVYSKFGIALSTGQAEEAVARITTSSHLELEGFHAHIGSQIFDVLPFRDNVARVIDFALAMQDRYGFELREISPGGGWGVQYTEADDPPAVEHIAEAIVSALCQVLAERGARPPKLVLEPGRSLVAQAGVTLYTAGSTKDITGVRKYVALDGGMADNIRPALYQARYEAIVANKAAQAATETVTLAGRYCESGDILIDAISLPPIEAGDIIAVPATGAYCVPMASNYNLSLKPPIVAVREGKATLIRRRETYQDLFACEVI